MTEDHPERLAYIRCGSAGRDGRALRSGSGYLVAPGLVLTARHVVVSEETGRPYPKIRVRVGHPRLDTAVHRCDGTVRWIGPGGLDVALLELAQRVEVPGTVLWGRPDGSEPISYTGSGFPWHGKAANGERGVEAFSGRLQPITGGSGVNDLYALDLGASPDVPADGSQAWRGVSGAAVFCRDRLVGVTIYNDDRHGNRRLRAVPVHTFATDTAFTDHLRRHGVGAPVLVAVDGRPPVPASGYRLEVRQQFAADPFEGRGEELARMTDFCTADDPAAPRYWRWLAPAWSGKTALMAQFVVDPPQGVDVLAFFVTRRQLGRSDQTAFLAVMESRLREYLHDPGLVCTSEGQFLHGLERAAEQARAAGRRLVLLVDGLDEDTGVPDGGSGHSIAALLPRRPAAGLRVLVAGRPDPPVPSDVLDEHPLHDRAIDHPLDVSPAARVARQAADRAMTELWAGPPLGLEVACVTAAAGGGLSAADLAHMARAAGEDRPRWAAWEVGQTLAGEAGRSFRRRQAEWTVDGADPEPLFSLGHDELDQAVLGRMTASLDTYRARVHAYADTWRAAGWPADTPEYVLVGYPVLLRQLGDVARLTDLATDPVRHERLWQTTGADAQALSEIADAFRLHVRTPEPDLHACLRLALHREALRGRGGRVTDDVILTWAELGRARRAIALARSANEPARLVDLLSKILLLDARPDIVAQATEAARAVSDPVRRTQALLVPVRTLARTGRAEAAVDLAREAAAVALTLTGPGPAPHPFAHVVEALVESGLADDALALLAGLPPRGLPAHAYERIAGILARAGRPHAAEALARTVDDPANRAVALFHVVRAHADADAPDTAGKCARTIDEPRHRAEAQNCVLRSLARAGRTAEALALAHRTVRLVRSQLQPAARTHVLNGVVLGLTEGGLVDEAHACARTVAPARRAPALKAVAQALIGAGRIDEAVGVAGELAELADESIDFARRTRRPHRAAGTLVDVVRLLADAGRPDDALARAYTIDDPETRLQALVVVAQALAGAGRTAQAVALAGDIVRDACALGEGGGRAGALVTVLHILVDAGHLDEALALARGITQAGLRAQVLEGVARTTAKDPGRADDVAALARAAGTPDRQAEVLASAARALARSGALDAAAGLAGEAVDLIPALSNPDRRAAALSAAAWALARAERTRAATERAREAMAVARAAGNHDRSSETQAAVVHSLAEAGRTGIAADAARLIDDPGRSAAQLVVVVGAMAREGRVREAEELARTIARSDRRADALTVLARTLLEADRPDDAHAVARTVDDPEKGASALVVAARALARAGRVTQARELARAIVQPDRRAEAMVALAQALAEADRIDEACALADGITEAEPRARVLSAVVRALALTGRPDRAGRLARTIEHPEHRAQATQTVVRALVADERFDRALGVARSIPGARARSAAHAVVVRALARSRGADEAMARVASVTDNKVRAQAMSDVVRALAEEGRTDEAVELARGITYTDRQAQAFVSVVAALTDQGRLTEALELIGTMTHTDRQEYELVNLVRFSAAEGRTGEALEVARTLTHADHRVRALLCVARVLGEEGDTDDAVALTREAVDLGRAAPDSEVTARALVGAALALAGADRADADEGPASKIGAEARALVAEALAAGNWVPTVEALALLAPEVLADLVALVMESAGAA
ncbi:trypsin-like serine protease [Streptomyces sp. NPDC002523]